MPSDAMSLSVSTGLGVSVLAGIISGVCFIIGYRRKINKTRERKWHCCSCNENFRSVDFILSGEEIIVCDRCKNEVCKSKCSARSNNELICRSCEKSKDTWTNEALKLIEPLRKSISENMSFLKAPSNDMVEAAKKTEQVRDFIERLVTDLLGDDVDNASINKIYNDENYLPIVGESPCSAHTALKRIIQKIIRETDSLPELKPPETQNIPIQLNKTYEDLLSTAILNKIISNSQNGACSSRTNSVCSRRSSSSKRRKLPNREYFFGEESLDNKWKNVDTDTASVSSLEEWVHSDSSLGSTKYVDRVSLTIKQRIDEVSSCESDRDEDVLDTSDIEYFRSSSANGLADEPNWFLQKRQFGSGTSSPVPVPMLVPDPKTEAKVLIGDKEIDDTSDLSDVENLEEDANNDPYVVLTDVKKHLIDSKKLIGGRNPLVDLSFNRHSDDEISADSGVKECKDLDEGDSEVFSTSNKNVYDYPMCSDESITEKDTEYTEKYATLPKTITILSTNNRAQNNEQEENGSDEEHIEANEECHDEDHYEFSGAYSRREKEKWKHAVELENNPYSPENIEKRINSKNSLNTLFGSDYYIKQSRLPSGARETEAKNCNEALETNDTMNNQESNDLKKELSQDEIENLTTPTASIVKSPYSETESLNFSYSEIASDSDISLVNCYDVTESVVYKKISAKNDDEEIQSAEKVFVFESLEEISEPSVVKPVAKPRKSLERIKSQNSIEKDMINSNETNGDTYVLPKKSDNTLIKKIYSDPRVGTFELNNRKTHSTEKDVPHEETVNSNEKTSSNQKLEMLDQMEKKDPIKLNDEVNELQRDQNENEYPTQFNIIGITRRMKNIDHSKTVHPDFEALDEINRLKEKKLVANRIREFSKSTQNLSFINDEMLDIKDVKHDGSKKNSTNSKKKSKTSKLEKGGLSSSVRDLRKKFEHFENFSLREKPILYSLTGRSISKQFKEKLRDLNEDSSLSQIHSLSLTNLEVEENFR